ncbi:expressed unknown protein [Seminavis robusta]|uniref:Uncharacterized protein n=1 Tax=Seminavis robusta TaxID=568900 RepID=A0A9N8HEP3_9STRA|nr:expressed unknown protein [Seminavis robusta]|eukprot:Sro394_g133790.1 n/a (491) ;mRNA; f:17015-18487
MPPRLPLRITSSSSRRSDSPRSNLRSHHRGIQAASLRSGGWPSNAKNHHIQNSQHRVTFHTTSTTCTTAQSTGTSTANTSTTTASTSPHQFLFLPVQQQQQQQPLLLLEGDELHVSREGIARSCYHLVDDEDPRTSSSSSSRWTIEERYNLEALTKTVVLREPVQEPFYASPSSWAHPRSTVSIELQEADTRQLGTGGTTWEASMAMALYFTHHTEELLQGDIVEVGSGVGLGGMLLHHILKTRAYMPLQEEDTCSITLTDGNEQVLQQCQDNLARYLGQQTTTTHQIDVHNIPDANIPLQAKKLDWNDVLHASTNHNNDASTRPEKKYNTVIACDCAYRRQDVASLKATLKSLLHRDPDKEGQPQSDSNCIHLFGPYNRSAYHQVIEMMKQDDELEVHVEWMQLSRYRLSARHHTNETPASSSKAPYPGLMDQWFHHGENPSHELQPLDEALKDSSKSSTKFLHVTAQFKSNDRKQTEDHQSSSIEDVD